MRIIPAASRASSPFLPLLSLLMQFFNRLGAFASAFPLLSFLSFFLKSVTFTCNLFPERWRPVRVQKDSFSIRNDSQVAINMPLADTMRHLFGFSFSYSLIFRHMRVYVAFAFPVQRFPVQRKFHTRALSLSHSYLFDQLIGYMGNFRPAKPKYRPIADKA